MKASHSSNFLRHYGELALNGRFFLVAANGRLRQGLNSGGGGGGGGRAHHGTERWLQFGALQFVPSARANYLPGQ